MATTLRINSLRFDAASGNSTVTVGANDTLDIAGGGILITNGVAAGNPTITGGLIRSVGFNELVVTHDGATTFTLASRLAGTTALTKTGSGVMVLNNANNTSTGSVRVTAGTLRLQGGGTIGDNAAVVLEATNNVLLDVIDSETIGSLSGGDASNYRNVAVQIASGKTLTVNQLAAGTFYGDIRSSSGAAVFEKTGAGTLTIADGLINVGVGGVINVNAGRLTLDVNGDNRYVQSIAAGTTVNVNARSSLFIEHNGVTAAGALTGGRVGDDVAFNLYSTGSTTDGLFLRNDQNIAMTELVGAVTFGAGVNSVRIDATTTTSNTTANIVLRGFDRSLESSHACVARQRYSGDVEPALAIPKRLGDGRLRYRHGNQLARHSLGDRSRRRRHRRGGYILDDGRHGQRRLATVEPGHRVCLGREYLGVDRDDKHAKRARRRNDRGRDEQSDDSLVADGDGYRRRRPHRRRPRHSHRRQRRISFQRHRLLDDQRVHGHRR
ncbi:MAG: autotransporter-associated beta strand repeat-containing protein [Pirellulales bacterium]